MHNVLVCFGALFEVLLDGGLGGQHVVTRDTTDSG